MVAAVLPRLESLVAGLEEAAAAAEESLQRLAVVEDTLSTVEKMIGAAGLEPQRYRGHALRLREALLLDRYGEAVEEAGRLCEAVSRDYAARRLGRSLETGCLDARTVELLEALLQAAGPLAQVVKSLVAAEASRRGLREGVAATAASWRRIAAALSTLYRAATALEKAAEVPRAAVIAKAAAIVERSEDPLAALEALSTGLHRLAVAAEEAGRLLVEVSEAARGCGPGARERLPCRLLDRASAALVAARSEAERVKSIEAPEEASLAAAAVEARLREARRSIEALGRLHAKLAGGEPGSLQAMVAALLESLGRHAVTQEEEQVLEILAEKETIDLMELHGRSPRLSRAALRLCTRGLAVCRVSL